MPVHMPSPKSLALAMTLAITLTAALTSPSFAVENEVITAPDGTIEIVVKDGMNCHRLQCFTLNLQNGTAQWAGSVVIDLPEGIDLSSGRMSVDTFRTILRAARNAQSEGVRSGSNAPAAGEGSTSNRPNIGDVNPLTGEVWNGDDWV